MELQPPKGNIFCSCNQQNKSLFVVSTTQRNTCAFVVATTKGVRVDTTTTKKHRCSYSHHKESPLLLQPLKELHFILSRESLLKLQPIKRITALLATMETNQKLQQQHNPRNSRCSCNNHPMESIIKQPVWLQPSK